MNYPAQLAALRACDPAVEWAAAQHAAGLTYQQAWDACDRGDWMLWLLGRTTRSAPWSDERKPLVAAAMECARRALPIYEARTGKTDVREASDVILAWTRGEATVGEAQEAYRRLRISAFADAAADYAADARSASLAESANIVRRHFPAPPELSNG